MTFAFYNQVGGCRPAQYIGVRLHQNGFPLTSRTFLIGYIKVLQNSNSLRLFGALANKVCL